MLSAHVKNMIVSSADLCNSDKTDGFLKHTTVIRRGDFSGGFLQAGVSELTMACVCIGIALHGGMLTAMGTFFCLLRLHETGDSHGGADGTPVKFVWSHDAFRVGEDGPTHEPVEQEAQIRLMEKLTEPFRSRLRACAASADVNETTVCWKMAMENMDTPTALIFSRQNVANLPEGTDYSGAERGAYTVVSDAQPEVVLVASGSEVSTLVAARQLLSTDGITSRVVSCPSEQLFRAQDEAYRESVIPRNAKKFFLTAGLPVVFEGLAGDTGRIFGLNHFGHSAPFKVLDEKFGFTPEAVYSEIKQYLGR